MNPYLILFLAIPLVAIVAKEIFKPKLSFWLIVIVYMAAGWGLANLAVDWHFSNLEAQLHSYKSPPAELLNKLQNDGAAYVFAYYFGWAYAAIYFLLCLWAYYTARFFIRHFRGLDA